MESRIIETETLGKFGIETLRARMDCEPMMCMPSIYSYYYCDKKHGGISLFFGSFLKPLVDSKIKEYSERWKPLCSEKEALEDAGKWFEKNKAIDPFYLLTFVERVIKLREHYRRKQDCIEEVNKDVKKIVQWAGKIIEKEWLVEG